ncbi:hypothetical protein [Streptomyces hirsutus]|uniref:hypothetical protein n=1 Tax=Streptomyces hirsutus TaxID=35620 RepID=UPI0012FF4096|nr:hypothetical protein [Streptomyces hirsutus]
MPWVAVGLWPAALVLAGPLAGKFGEVRQNRAVDYPPDSAEHPARRTPRRDPHRGRR